MPIQIGAKGATIAGVNYPPYTYLDFLSPAQEGVAVQGGDAFYVPARGGMSAAANLVRTAAIPSARSSSVSSGYLDGPTPWRRLFGPNELRQVPWVASAEALGTAKYVTAASPANGPCLFRREGASIWIDGGVVTANAGNPTYCNLNTGTSAGLAAGALAAQTLAILVYCHRLGVGAVRLRVGTTSGDYVYYQWSSANGELVEGWNVLLVSTSEPIGAADASPGGQHDFHTGGAVKDGWRYGTGTQTFTFAQAIGYMALECTGLTARTSLWFEGIYAGGKDVPAITIGFDIQGPGLASAKSILDARGLVGYAAVPTGNANPANPQHLWSAADVARLQGIYGSWDVLQHSVSHNSFGALSDESLLDAEFEACRQQLIAAGLPGAADLYTSPNNSFSNRVIALMARAGIKWARHGPNAPLLQSRGLIGLCNPLLQGAISIALSASGDAADITRFGQWLALLKLYGVAGHVYTHAVTAAPTVALDTRDTTFAAMADLVRAEVASGAMVCLSPTSFIRDGSPPSLSAITAAPNRLTLTVGASPFDLANTSYRPLRYVISGGTVSNIQITRDAGTTLDATGATGGQFDLQPGDRLRITHTGAPTVVQYSI